MPVILYTFQVNIERRLLNKIVYEVDPVIKPSTAVAVFLYSKYKRSFMISECNILPPA
jgi:hypothetical protein